MDKKVEPFYYLACILKHIAFRIVGCSLGNFVGISKSTGYPNGSGRIAVAKMKEKQAI